MAETLGWRWEFGVQVPILALCLGITLMVLPRDIGLPDGSKSVWIALKQFDIKGSMLLAASTTGLILGLVSHYFI
jgi:predicted MFS family arabinose efflux permease